MANDIKDVLVVILGGGRGKRLYPLTKNRAKPAVSFGGKYRLIDIPVTNCLKSQLNRIFILTQFNSFSLNRHIWQAYSQEVGRDGFIDVVAAEQTLASGDWYQGTADAVRQTMQYILYHKPKYVLILSGDQVYSMDFRELLNWHIDQKADITIAAHFTPSNQLEEFGIIKPESDFRVVDFYEKPSDPEHVKNFHLDKILHHPSDKPFLASMGIYLFNTSSLSECLDNNDVDFGKTIIPKAAAKYIMKCFPFDGYWEDVGTIKTFYDANMEWRKGGGISALFQGGTSIVTHSRQLPPTRIYGTFIEDSIIADGGDIHAETIRRSIIGVRTRIGSKTTIEDSIIMGNDNYNDNGKFEIENNCVIKNTICDKNVIVGQNSRIINQQNIREYECDMFVIKNGIIVIPPGTSIPAGTII